MYVSDIVGRENMHDFQIIFKNNYQIYKKAISKSFT